ncbi:MAG: FadR/GntR family transcriptional regulator [Eubacteriales bacterium]
MDTELFNNIKNTEQPLAARVAEQISQLIIEQHIGLNDKLPNEFELASKLNVGRGTIREAVKILVARNVLVIQRGKGTFVANNPGVADDPFGFAYITDELKLAEDLLNIRLLLEPWAARMAAEKATNDNIDLLIQINASINQKLNNNQSYSKEDEQFHVIISQFSQNLVLPKIIPVVVYSIHQLLPINMSSTYYSKIKQDTMDTHQAIIDAIITHNPDSAEKAMITHLNHNLRILNEKNLRPSK